MPLCANCGELPRSAFSKAQLKKRSGAALQCSSCTSAPGSNSGQFTAAVHQRARDAEAAGRQKLAEEQTAAVEAARAVADETVATETHTDAMEVDLPLHDRVASDLDALNVLLAACAHNPLDERSYFIFGNWLKCQGTQSTVANVCAWERFGAHDRESLNAMLEADGRQPLDDRDFEAFQRWIGRRQMHEESVGDWENSPEGEQWAAQRIADGCVCQARCTCTWRGIELQPILPGVTCDDYRGIDDLGELINYGSRPGEWQPSGGDHVPDTWVGDGTLDNNYDTDYAGIPNLTSFCTCCRQIRHGEPGLSHVELRPNGEPYRVCDHMCQRCARTDPPEDMM